MWTAPSTTVASSDWVRSASGCGSCWTSKNSWPARTWGWRPPTNSLRASSPRAPRTPWPTPTCGRTRSTMPESTCAAPLPIRPAPPSGPLEQGREFAWTQADFARVQALIRPRAGISLHDGKHAMVYSPLSRRLRDTGHRSFHDYLAWLQTHDGPEWQEFVNALTTNLTAFFREQHHFGILAAHLRAKSAAASAPAPHWRLWCSAASTGEEPYSIAMTVLETLGAHAAFTLVASDIDSRVLATAAQGVYRLDGLKRLGAER